MKGGLWNMIMLMIPRRRCISIAISSLSSTCHQWKARFYLPQTQRRFYVWSCHLVHACCMDIQSHRLRSFSGTSTRREIISIFWCPKSTSTWEGTMSILHIRREQGNMSNTWRIPAWKKGKHLGTYWIVYHQHSKMISSLISSNK